MPNPQPNPRRKPRPEGRPLARAAARYALAVGAAFAATLLMVALYDLLGLARGSAPFIFYFAAVAFTARYLGRGPGHLAVVLSAAAADFFFIVPFNAVSHDAAAVLQVCVFLAVAGFIVELTERARRAWDASLKSDRSLAITLRSIGDAVISTDAEGRVNFMNPVAQRLTGWDIADARGRPLEEVFRIINEQTRETVESPVTKVLREGRVVGLANHTLLLARGGGEVPVEDSGAPITGPDGRLAGVVLVFHDVSDRRSADAERAGLAQRIEGERRRLLDLVGSVPGVVWEAWGTPDEGSQRIDFVSEYVGQMLGYTVEEWLSTPNFWLTIVHPDDRERAAAEAHATYESRRGGASEFRWLARDGRVIHVEARSTVILDERGGPVGMRGVTMDISARKRAEQDLRDSQVRLEGVVESAMDAIVTVDAAQRVVLFNAAAEKMFRCEAAEAVGRPLDRFIPPRFRGEHGRHIEGFGRTGVTTRAMAGARAVAGLRADGEEFPLEASISQIEAGGQKLYTVIMRDITERQRAEEELRASEERYRALAEANAQLYVRAQEVNRAKDEFLAVLSHELRTPLTPIIGWTHMIRSGRLPERDVNRGLDVIDKNSQSLSRLINDLLDMSSILSGKMRIERAPVELQAVLREAAETVRPLADLRRVALEVETGGLAPVVVAGDRTRLVQVFWNLLNNAVKFSDEGGRVRLRLRAEGELARVEVEDEGAGITPDFLPHVFERFRQADMRTTRAHGGLGIGLALVKSYVEAHEGRVEARSDGEGRGSRFVVTLPVAEPAKAGTHEPPGALASAADSPADGHVRRVLIVEDAPDTLDMLRVVFAARGYEATTCSTPEEALGVAESGRFDIIVSDIGLPRVDGYELLGRLRSLPHLAGVPALALTGYASQKDAEAAFAAGFDAHVAKPVEPSALAEQVERLLKRGGAGDGASSPQT
jgi:PAS domain S-box-containing protein